jgi:putative endonuclease
MPKVSTNSRGQAGEEAAVKWLQTRGYRIIARNWRPGNAVRGEIDCVAWDATYPASKVLCFVEVKARRRDSSAENSAPQEAVTVSKQRQLSRLANAYVSLYQCDDLPCRFDVVEVWQESDGAATKLALHKNAFDYQGQF